MNDIVLRSHKTTPRFVATVMFVAAMLFSLLATVTPSAYAADGDSAAADSQLQTFVYKKMGGEKYPMEGGGYISGMDIFELQEGGTVTVRDAEFAKLSSKGQRLFVDDIVTNTGEATDEGNPLKEAETPLVTDQTASNWLGTLQSTPGIGSKMLSTILSETKADFNKANDIYRPFSGIVGTTIGLITVLTMAALVLSMAIDLAYIVLPFFREQTQSGTGAGGRVNRLVSQPARAAVSEAEGPNGGDSKEPLWIYLKKRFVGILILAVAILLLVNGEVFNAVGSIIDLGSGFISSWF